jgi:xanthine dehydrogenase accessory factor
MILPQFDYHAPQTVSQAISAVLKESLIASGEDAGRVNAIVAPAGAAIGPQTPEEIALAVLAAVVAARRSEVNDAAALSAPPLARACCGG